MKPPFAESVAGVADRDPDGAQKDAGVLVVRCRRDAGHFAFDTAADAIAVLIHNFAGDAAPALVGRAG